MYQIVGFLVSMAAGVILCVNGLYETDTTKMGVGLILMLLAKPSWFKRW